MKIYMTALCFLAGYTLYTQNITEALRYSTENNYGSARYNALSGAFGALGGEISALDLNPASSAVFIDNASNLSLGVYHKKNEADYHNSQEISNYTKLDLHQAGGVFVYHNNHETSSWKKFTLGINYQMTNNYDDEMFVSGIGNQSVSRYFLHYAQGIPLHLLQTLPGESVGDLYAYLGQHYGYGHQQALLGYQGYIIDPLDPDNNDGIEYVPAVAGNTFSQHMSYYTSGYHAKVTLNLGAQIGNNIYGGINFNLHNLEYVQSSFFDEINSNPGSVIREIYFDNHLAVEGSGVSTQIGLIAKTGENIRLGLNYHSPVWFTVYEESYQELETRRVEGENTITTVVNPNVVNVYEEYRYRTPGKITGSIAYVFGSRALISADYSYKDYSGITYKADNSVYFRELNKAIDNTLQAVSMINIGGEYRYHNWSVRGGYRYESSPYRNQALMSALQGFSAGLGCKWGNFKLDASYAHTAREYSEQLFQNAGFSSAATVNGTIDFYTLTATFDF